VAVSWHDVGAAADVDPEQPFPVEVDGLAVVVARCADGFFAVEDRCTHDGEPLAGGEVVGDRCQIVCPRHGARFCLKTGEALAPPAYEPVRTFEVREQNGRLLLALPQ
jgi:3-phenylpropionate/trans-cinnamate dioxygenase ferredoxin component